MPFTAENLQDIEATSKKQVAALLSNRELAALYLSDPMTYSRQIYYKESRKPLKDVGIDVDGGFWLYVKPVPDSSYTLDEDGPPYVNRIKLHIPLKDWKENGLMIANIINSLNLKGINSIKTINPLVKEISAEKMAKHDRAQTGAPITIYFNPLATPYEIAQAIYQINKKLSEVDALKPVNSNDAASSDQKRGQFCAITIDRKGALGKTYVPGNSPEGAAERQELLKKSPEIKKIDNILPDCDILEKIDLYLEDRSSKGTYTSCWGFFVRAYTKEQKITAATALKEAILNKDISSISLNDFGALNQGRLKDVFQTCQLRYPDLLDNNSLQQQCQS